MTPLIGNGFKLVVALAGEHTRNRLLVFTEETDAEYPVLEYGTQRVAGVVQADQVKWRSSETLVTAFSVSPWSLSAPSYAVMTATPVGN